uniref:Amino acid permease/ SLC12A domain-containing protein n=1 Tax=Hemiselmis andersenii TaxID=464988 RepID=A0A7S1EF27_HEMAN|mmetsp:Transcript_466/g.1135  ORF Transcript_466/g.1135 Transcript_466/m.1135 type:complete len:446 (+) Transcript_466:2-1339(+)
MVASPRMMPHKASVGVMALAGILFFQVSGGPFGTEGLVRDGGAIYSVIGLLILPFLWSFPVGLMTAELGTAFPKDGGYVLWVEAAFGREWAFQTGIWAWTSGIFDTALYPVLFASFVQSTLWPGSVPADFSPALRGLVMLGFSALMTLVNLLGLEMVGIANQVFGACVIAPVGILVAVCLPRIKPSNWLRPSPKFNPIGWVNIAMWNLSGWDAASTIGDEVVDPSSTIPRALGWATVLVTAPYILTILAAAGVDADFGTYHNGRFNSVAEAQGGQWLGGLFALGSAASAMGMYLSDSTTTSYLISGMSEGGLLPPFLARRFPPLFDTPVIPILAVFACVTVLLHMPFTAILQCENFLYSLQLLIEIAALIKLRYSHPDLPRPFKIPLGTKPLIAVMMMPAGLCILQLVTSEHQTILLSGVIVAIGGVLGVINSRIRDPHKYTEVQ